MRSRYAAVITAVAVLTLGRAASAAPIGQSIGSLADNAHYFQSLVNAIQRHDAGAYDERRPDGGKAKDSSGGNLVPGFGSGGAGYVVGGAVVVGVVASFIFDNGGGSSSIDADDPIIAEPNQPGTPHNEGDPNGQVLPDVPDGATVTPEPEAFLLLGTGLSSLGAISYRRRRR